MENNYCGGGRGGRYKMESTRSAKSDAEVLNSDPYYLGAWMDPTRLLVGESEDLKLFMAERSRHYSGGELGHDSGQRGVADAHCPSCGEKQEPRRLSQGQMTEMTRMNGQPEVVGVGSEGGGGGRRRDEKRVTLNVGGQVFETSIETLSFDPCSVLAAMVKRHLPSKKDEIFFIDRDPVRFRHVLNYMRTQTIWLDDLSDLRAVQEEADFFNLEGMYNTCEALICEILRVKDEKFEADMVLKSTLGILMVEVKNIKKATESENHESNQNREQPISGVRRRGQELYEALKHTVFSMDEDF